MSSYYPDPAPTEDVRYERLYDVIDDVLVDGKLFLAKGDVVGQPARDLATRLSSVAGAAFEVHQREIPFDGGPVPFDDEPIQEWQPAEDTMRYMREEVWG